MKKIILLVVLTVSLICLGACGAVDTAVEPAETKLIVDVSQFANVSSDELVALLGEPDDICEGICHGAFEIPCIYYDYNNAGAMGEVSFALVNDAVVRFTSYNDYPYNEETLFEQFGLAKGDLCTVVGGADDSSAIRYRCPTDQIEDFNVQIIEDDTFGFLQITYDMVYYDEWYLPLGFSEEVDYKTKTQTAVESILKSPKSADFPAYDWQYGKNNFYVLVSSYVNAQNSFGAELRSEFTFVYSAVTGDIVLAIFDGERIIDTGYIPTEELVFQLAYASKESDTNVENPVEAEVDSADDSMLMLSPFSGWVGAYTEVGFIGATASSELNADSILFAADYAIDDQSNRPWIEGTYGSGIGETLTLYFDGEKTIDILALQLGYARSDEFYYLNNRPSMLRFTFSDGRGVDYSFEDINRQNVIELSEPVTTSYVEITIIDVYEGTDDDTCIYLVEAYSK